MQFTRKLRDGVRRGEITCSVRIWKRPHVKVGGRYLMDQGEIEVDSIVPITLEDITPTLARKSGFKGVVDLLKTAKHGSGDQVYLVQFHYLPPSRKRAARSPRARPAAARRSGPRVAAAERARRRAR